MRVTAAMTAELAATVGSSMRDAMYALQLFNGDKEKAADRLKMQHRAPLTVEQEVAIRCIVNDELVKFFKKATK